MDKKDGFFALFPYDVLRNGQRDIISYISFAIQARKNALLHAPTGLGKTAAALSPAVEFALDKDLTVFFLTSRQTQHKLAIETLRAIKDKHGKPFLAVDITAKQSMCAQPNVDKFYAQEFGEFCTKLKEAHACDYYTNFKKGAKISSMAQAVLERLEQSPPMLVHDVMQECIRAKLCPFEISVLLAKKARVVIADYNYLFNLRIQEKFLLKTERSLGKAIIIVDEAHNLPGRVREQLSKQLTTVVLRNAIAEAKRVEHPELVPVLEGIRDVLTGFGNAERIVPKEEFITALQSFRSYDKVQKKLQEIGDAVLKEHEHSAIVSIGDFLEAWLGPDECFARMLTHEEGKRERITKLQYACLDPSVVTKRVIDESYATIGMSGTLTPMHMYADLLGMEKPLLLECQSPFPDDNRLSLIVTNATTSYRQRTAQEFERLAKGIAEATNAVPGNSLVFFPSYALLQSIGHIFTKLSTKTVLRESQGLSKQERLELLELFKKHHRTGAVLLATTSGSYGEGIDLPGNLLRCVVVVGIPLQPPTLEVRELIKYYDHKFKKGREYGYFYPAFIKILQNAGRCIRSETDRGVLIFYDERYALPTYKNCFPHEWDVKQSTHPRRIIEEFFEEK